ncbi:MAG: orotidine-5'-phosphate decarboxylase [Crocinitomicaceae bacterium]|tara:strand:- start:1626 stop:2438 length:813 start_codon:yes stop_codon:yes gene_type:complete
MKRSELIHQIKAKKSFLCVGLDPDLAKIPEHLLDLDDPIFEFNKAIIDATKEYAVAYKPNLAFYECLGIAGWRSFQKTVEYIPKECLVVADAKRGDIGNTSLYYAKTFFETYNCDALTIAPYMGSDSVEPFLTHPNKWAVVLALTSNKGANDFQFLESNEKPLFESVVNRCLEWGTPENLMFVVGATRSEDIGAIRALAPDSFFLVPGVGAQGGSLAEVVRYGMTSDCGLLVNSSRGIIYADHSTDFALGAKKEASKIQSEMKMYLKRFL